MKAAFRLVKTRHAATAFDGEGARLYGGRWNPRGTRAVYLSESLSLAALEMFVHVGKAGTALSLAAIEVGLPAELTVETLAEQKLPEGWRAEPPLEATQALGARFIERGAAVALRVPSVLVPHEANYLLNPAHRDFGKLKIKAPLPFSYDPRMWK